MTASPNEGWTCVADEVWVRMPSRLRPYERTVRLGDTDDLWRRAADAVMRWGAKTGSGFTVHPAVGTDSGVVNGTAYTLIAAVGPLRVREPVRVVSVVDALDRRGFAYATRRGHPVTGEEAFIVHRAPDGGVWFTLRSLTGPGHGRWRPMFPVILLAQRWYRCRYVRAMRAIADREV